MGTARRLSLSLTAIVLLVAAAPADAADAELDRFKAQIDAVTTGLGPGVAEWVGAEPWELRRDGDDLIATVTNGKMVIHADPQLRLGFDRLEIRETPARDSGKSVALAILLPKAVTLEEAGGSQIKIALDDARANMVLDAASGRARDTALTIAAIRLDHADSQSWVSIGPLTMSSKLIAEPGGGWSAPAAFEFKKLEFALPSAPAAGSVERLSVSRKSAGPKLETLEQLGDTLDALQTDKESPPDVRLARVIAVLPGVPSVFGTIQANAVLEGLKARGDGSEPLASLAKIELTATANGFDADVASIRFGVREDGLELAPPLFDARLVPRRIVIDLGVENLQTATLRAMLQAAAQSGGDDTEKQQASQQMLSALATLNPTFRIYNIAVDTAEIGADLKAEAKGSPLLPSGYTANGDFVVRGFDAIPGLVGPAPFAEYLPVLRELAVPGKAADGAPRASFHLASSPEKLVQCQRQRPQFMVRDPRRPTGRR